MSLKFLLAFLALFLVLSMHSVAFAEEVADAAQPISETATEVVSAETAAEPVTVVEEHSDYHWGSSCELGFDLTEGNASTRNLLGKCHSEHAIDIWKVSLMGSVKYGIARFGGSDTTSHGAFVENANDWMAGVKEEVYLDDAKRVSLFAEEKISSNHFAGYWVRKALAAGAGYAYVATDTQNHSVEAGFHYDHDSLVLVNADGHRSESRYALLVALAGSMKMGEYISGNYHVSWSPNLQEFAHDNRIEGEAGVTFQLAENLAYKVSGTLVWDQDPDRVPLRDPVSGAETAGTAQAKKIDTALSNLLVVTFH